MVIDGYNWSKVSCVRGDAWPVTLAASASSGKLHRSVLSAVAAITVVPSRAIDAHDTYPVPAVSRTAFFWILDP